MYNLEWSYYPTNTTPPIHTTPHIELVDSEVIGKQKELLVDTVRGDPGAKIEYMVMDNTSHRACSRQMLGWGFGVQTMQQ